MDFGPGSMEKATLVMSSSGGLVSGTEQIASPVSPLNLSARIESSVSPLNLSAQIELPVSALNRLSVYAPNRLNRLPQIESVRTE